MICSPPGSSCPCTLPGKNIGAGCHFLLQEIFQPRDRTLVSFISHIGRWIFYHCATCEAHTMHKHVFIYKMYTQAFIFKCIVGIFTFNKLLPACTHSHLTRLNLCDPMDSSPLGFFLHRILQAILEWVAVPASRGYS